VLSWSTISLRMFILAILISDGAEQKATIIRGPVAVVDGLSSPCFSPPGDCAGGQQAR
jgi:hypothetical protein